MPNKTLIQMIFLTCLLIIAAFVNSARAEDPAGKKIFMENKCNSCHSIESQAITKKLASSKAPDLSNVGSEHKADWITKYLNKEETKNDKKHSKAWTGKKEDLETLVKWLETLKKAQTK
ncbi:cytochrome c [bacterium]|nr:cytochrome c [bacterium]MCI0606490.1 cytochrome c [bacterium]